MNICNFVSVLLRMKKYIIGIFLTVSLCVTGCTAFRAVKGGTPSTDTFAVFDLDTISSITIDIFIDPQYGNSFFNTTKFTGGRLHDETVGEYFSRVRGNGSLLIIRNDTVLLEEYYGNFSKDASSNIFSITKAITALLCGIAIDEGYIGSIHDPVTRYLPELAYVDSLFSALTIEHLLDMRTGLEFDENYSWNPFSQIAQLYYNDDMMKVISKSKFKEHPGQSHDYNSLATAILGAVIERATGMRYANYLEAKVWGPLGMEGETYVALDSRKHHNAKAYGGIATSTRNVARIGRLYLNGGKWGDRQIVSKEWIDRSTHSMLDNEAYSYGWNYYRATRGKNVCNSKIFCIRFIRPSPLLRPGTKHHICNPRSEKRI